MVSFWAIFAFRCLLVIRAVFCLSSETLRKYPVVPIVSRVCVQDYQIHGTKQIVEKGVKVFIPTYAFHMDDKYYHEPEQFKPSRFCFATNSRPYLPFGDSSCADIAARMAKIQTKICLIIMLRKFRYAFETKLMNCDMVFDPKSVLLTPKDPIKLQIFKR